jgi:hypothetical protein
MTIHTEGTQMKLDNAVTIRRASEADASLLGRLAALDSSHPPVGDALIAEVAGEPWAAIGVADGHAVADPFHPSADAVELLRLRARGLREAPDALVGGPRQAPRFQEVR